MSSPPTSYFTHLAPELIQLIFLHTLTKRCTYYLEYTPTTPPLVLLLVCKRWHYLALRTPGLFDSLSLRRRVHAPYGFDFNRDSWVLYDFLHFPRHNSERGLALQIAYGDIGKYGDGLMWGDLLRMVRIIIDTTSALERVYLRFPDDCMEKLLAKISGGAGGGIGKPFKHERMKSLTLHSTREQLIQQRYVSWWSDALNAHTPTYHHTLDLSHLPALSELGLHYPGPIALSPVLPNVRTLHVSIFKWDQLEEYFAGCPNVTDVTLELRVPLRDQKWDVEGLIEGVRFAKVRSLEIRSEMGSGRMCASKIMRLFVGLKVPNLRSLRLRRLLPSSPDSRDARDAAALPEFRFGSLILSTLPKLHELAFIDFLPESCSAQEIAAMFTNTPNLRSFTYREVEFVSCPRYFARLLSALTFDGRAPVRAPRLNTLELESVHLKGGENGLVQSLFSLIASRCAPSFILNTASKRRPALPLLPSALRLVRLPSGCARMIRDMDTFGMCKDVVFDGLSEIEEMEVEKEGDLDEEGEARSDGEKEGGREKMRWRGVREPAFSFAGARAEVDRAGATRSSMSASSSRTDASASGIGSASASERSAMSVVVEDSILEIEGMFHPTQDQNQDMNGLSVTTTEAQGSLGLGRLDSLAEVEHLLS